MRGQPAHTIFRMPIPGERGKHKRPLLRDTVYVSLRDAIINGTFAPGEKLRDVELEQWLGVSRTPIREAIAKLEAAGLVHTEPGRSTVVSAIETRAVADAQAVAASLYELSVRLAVPMMGEPEFTAMEQANQDFARALDGGDVDRALDADALFHQVAVDSCGNAVVASMLDQVTPVLRRVERLRFGSLSGRTSIEQHRQILDHCRAGNAAAAALATRQNWETLEMLIRPAVS